MNGPPRFGLGAARRLAVGTIIGAVALWLTFRGADLIALRRHLGQTDITLTVLALGSVAASLTLAAVRWRLLLYPGEPGGAWRHFLGAVVIGQMVNILLPIRLGELARAYIVSRAERQPLGKVLGTVAAERASDVVVLGLTVAALLLAGVPAWAEAPGRAVLVTSLIVAAAIAAMTMWRTAAMRRLQRIVESRPTGVVRSTARLFDLALQGLAAFGRRDAGPALAVLSVLLILSAAATNYLLFLAMRLAVPAYVALLLVVVLQMGTGLAGTPGNLGVFHYLTVLVLTTFGVDQNVALGYSILLYGVAILPKIVVGSIIVGFGPRATFGSRVWIPVGGTVNRVIG